MRVRIDPYLPRLNQLELERASLAVFIHGPASASTRIEFDFRDHGGVAGPLEVGLDIAESLFKAVPLVGPVVESVCGTLKKILSGAEVSIL